MSIFNKEKKANEAGKLDITITYEYMKEGTMTNTSIDANNIQVEDCAKSLAKAVNKVCEDFTEIDKMLFHLIFSMEMKKFIGEL